MAIHAPSDVCRPINTAKCSQGRAGQSEESPEGDSDPHRESCTIAQSGLSWVWDDCPSAFSYPLHTEASQTGGRHSGVNTACFTPALAPRTSKSSELLPRAITSLVLCHQALQETKKKVAQGRPGTQELGTGWMLAASREII